MVARRGAGATGRLHRMTDHLTPCWDVPEDDSRGVHQDVPRRKLLYVLVALSLFLATSCQPGEPDTSAAREDARRACDQFEQTKQGFADGSIELSGLAEGVQEASELAAEAAGEDPQWAGLATVLAEASREFRSAAEMFTEAPGQVPFPQSAVRSVEGQCGEEFPGRAKQP